MTDFRWDDLTPEQKASGEYGFVSDVTGLVSEGDNTTNVYRKVPDEVSNKGRVLTWKRVWVFE